MTNQTDSELAERLEQSLRPCWTHTKDDVIREAAARLRSPAPDDAAIDDAAWERALKCACSQFESYARKDQLATPEQRRIALDDAMQHAVGLLKLSLLSALTSAHREIAALKAERDKQ